MDPTVLRAVKSDTAKTLIPSTVVLSLDSLAAIRADLRSPAVSRLMIEGMDSGSVVNCALAADEAWDWHADVPSFSLVRLLDFELAAAFLLLPNDTLLEDGFDDFSPSEGCTWFESEEEDGACAGLNVLSWL